MRNMASCILEAVLAFSLVLLIIYGREGTDAKSITDPSGDDSSTFPKNIELYPNQKLMTLLWKHNFADSDIHHCKWKYRGPGDQSSWINIIGYDNVHKKLLNFPKSHNNYHFIDDNYPCQNGIWSPLNDLREVIGSYNVTVFKNIESQFTSSIYEVSLYNDSCPLCPEYDTVIAPPKECKVCPTIEANASTGSIQDDCACVWKRVAIAFVILLFVFVILVILAICILYYKQKQPESCLTKVKLKPRKQAAHGDKDQEQEVELLTRKTDELKDKENRISELKVELQKAKDELKDKENRISELKVELQKAKLSRKEIIAAKDDQHKEVTNLLKDHRDEKKHEAEEWRNKCEAMVAERTKNMESEIQNLKTQLKSMQKSLTGKDGEIFELKSNLKDEKIQKIYESKLRDKDREIKQISEERDMFKKQNEQNQQQSGEKNDVTAQLIIGKAYSDNMLLKQRGSESENSNLEDIFNQEFSDVSDVKNHVTAQSIIGEAHSDNTLPKQRASELENSNQEDIFTQEFSDVVLRPGDDLTLAVTVKKQQTDVKWYRYDDEIFNGPNVEIQKDNLEYKLKMSRDMNLAGMYRCVGTNGTICRTVTAKVNVEEGEEQAPIFVKWIKGEKYVTEGNQIKLRVIAEGKPAPKITWYQDNKAVNKSHKTDVNDFKTTSNVTFTADPKTDNGVYEAVAENHLGKATCSSKLTVIDIKSPPSLNRKMNDKKAKVGEEVTFNVTFVGSPKIKLLWTKDRIWLNKPDSNCMDITDVRDDASAKSHLTIKNAQKNDAGEIACIALSEFGIHWAVSQLTVEENDE